MIPTLPNGRKGREQVAATLDGRVAVVSGVGPGLGRESALIMARHGADVVLGARRRDVIEDVAAEIEGLGRRAIAVPTDITVPDDCRRLAATADEQLGSVDVLVNNAIYMRASSDTPFDVFERSDLEGWRRDMDVNYWGTLHMTQAVVPYMRAVGSGSIVMVNTMYTRVILPTYGAYVGTKGALETVTKTLAAELGPEGIRVNQVHPGYIYGAAWEEIFEQMASDRGVTADDVYGEFAARTSLGYLPPSAEIAGAVLFLASDLSAAMTGQSVHVNGGEYYH